jgi:hypothetical protein
MRRNQPCALAVLAAALALLLAQVARGQEARVAENDGEARVEGVGAKAADSASDDLGLKIMQETSRMAREDRSAAGEAARAAQSTKLEGMREKKERTRERQEEERTRYCQMLWIGLSTPALLAAPSRPSGPLYRSLR